MASPHRPRLRSRPAAAGLALLAACAGTPSPVLYPNAHLQTVGQAAAERDIAQCRQLASTSGVAEQRSGQVGSNAATGAAVGGASAGAWGLVRGNAAENALAGAAAGAVLVGLLQQLIIRYGQTGIDLPFLAEPFKPSPTLVPAASLVLMVVILLALPSGLFGRIER